MNNLLNIFDAVCGGMDGSPGVEDWDKMRPGIFVMN